MMTILQINILSSHLFWLIKILVVFSQTTMKKSISLAIINYNFYEFCYLIPTEV